MIEYTYLITLRFEPQIGRLDGNRTWGTDLLHNTFSDTLKVEKEVSELTVIQRVIERTEARVWEIYQEEQKNLRYLPDHNPFAGKGIVMAFYLSSRMI